MVRYGSPHPMVKVFGAVGHGLVNHSLLERSSTVVKRYSVSLSHLECFARNLIDSKLRNIHGTTQMH